MKQKIIKALILAVIITVLSNLLNRFIHIGLSPIIAHFIIPALFSMVVLIIVILVFMKFIEKKPLNIFALLGVGVLGAGIEFVLRRFVFVFYSEPTSSAIIMMNTISNVVCLILYFIQTFIILKLHNKENQQSNSDNSGNTYIV